MQQKLTTIWFARSGQRPGYRLLSISATSYFLIFLSCGGDDDALIDAKFARMQAAIDLLNEQNAQFPFTSDATGWGAYIIQMQNALNHFEVLAKDPGHGNDATWTVQGFRIRDHAIQSNTAVHELTHAVDYLSSGPAKSYVQKGGRQNERLAEGVAYAAEHVYGGVVRLRSVENAIRAQECDRIESRWDRVWSPFQRPLTITRDKNTVWVLDDRDFLNFFAISKVTFRCEELASAYMKFASENGCCVRLKCDKAPSWAR